MRKMHWLLTVGVVLCVGGSVLCLAQDAAGKGKKKVLMYSQSMGFRHSVVARPLTGEMSYAEKQIKEILGKAGYEVSFTQDFNDMRGDTFKKFDAIIFYTTGKDLPIDRNAMMDWLKKGGALIGIHSATDTFYDWPEYGKLMGGYFAGHGGNQEKITIKVEDPDSPATRPIKGEWRIADEIYQLKDFSKDNVHMLLSVDTDKMSEAELKHHHMEKGKYYPIAYTNTLEKGRIFYTSLGHREDVFTNEMYREHLLGGIAWALGTEK